MADTSDPAAAAAPQAAPPGAPSGALVLHLEGFDGPLDLLLDLARAQKFDLSTISILALVDQFLAVIEGAGRVRLELAADWLVMAAWLAWLKSRLLLPPGDAAAEEGEEAAANLAERLRELDLIRRLADWLSKRPQLGQDVFARGAEEDMEVIDRSQIRVDMPSLLRGYLVALRRAHRADTYRPKRQRLWSVQDALARLGMLVGQVPDWTELSRFLPDTIATPLERRGAMASTLLASLEMARTGTARLRQESAFGPILLRGTQRTPEDEAGHA